MTDENPYKINNGLGYGKGKRPWTRREIEKVLGILAATNGKMPSGRGEIPKLTRALFPKRSVSSVREKLRRYAEE